MPGPDGCDLCEDGSGSPLYLHGKCHLTAPFLATLEGDKLTLRCYIPECGRVVAVFTGVRQLPDKEASTFP